MDDERQRRTDRLIVTSQVLLEGVVLLGTPLEAAALGVGWQLGPLWVNVVLGGVLFVAGLLVASRAKRDLARSFSASPTPVDGGALIESGIYARQRHPMYLGVLLLTFGWGIAWGSWLGLVGSLVMTAFLVFKSRREDRLLAARYPGYAAYRERVPGGILPR